jgi:hypothetical protein
MKARILFFLLVVMAIVVSPADAHAQAAALTNPSGLPQRQANFTWDKPEKGPERLTASFSYVDVADGALRSKLTTGLPTTVVMRAYLLREGEPEPIALAARTCKITYDLWEEVFRLQVSGPNGVQNTAAPNVNGVLRQCFEARSLFIAERPQISAKPHLLAVIVEVNPVNAQMVEQMRKWVTRPAGSTGIGPGDALFGSFVGLFVKDISKADRTLLFRTQPIPAQ